MCLQQITVRLTPKASQNAITGWYKDTVGKDIGAVLDNQERLSLWACEKAV